MDIDAPVAGKHVITEHTAYVFVQPERRAPAQRRSLERVGADILEILTAEAPSTHCRQHRLLLISAKTHEQRELATTNGPSSHSGGTRWVVPASCLRGLLVLCEVRFQEAHTISQVEPELLNTPPKVAHPDPAVDSKQGRPSNNSIKSSSSFNLGDGFSNSMTVMTVSGRLCLVAALV